jgi:flagellar biosynthetic protein FlhB
MSEDRTQPASARRRQVARQRGHVAHSPELTASVGWLVATAALAALSGKLTSGLASLIDRTMTTAPVVFVDQTAVVTRIRECVGSLVWPFLMVSAAFAAGAMGAHLVQVRGLWSPQLLVPDVARLWARPRREGLSGPAERILWLLVKTTCLVAVWVWSIDSAWGEILQLGCLEGPALARAAGQVLIRIEWFVAGTLLILGLVDYAIIRRRFDLILRTTPQQQREDQRVMEGDPAVRAQRYRVARSWRDELPEVVNGASLMVTGLAGLTVVLAGGPPPRRVSIRATKKGNVGLRLRHLASARNISLVEAPDLARRLARSPSAGSSVAAELSAELASIWPAV